MATSIQYSPHNFTFFMPCFSEWLRNISHASQIDFANYFMAKSSPAVGGKSLGPRQVLSPDDILKLIFLKRII